MDISNLLANSSASVKLQPKLAEALTQLQASTKFDATVLKNTNGEIRLNSKFGELTVFSKLPLLAGDKISARLVQQQSQWVVKVFHHETKSLLIPINKSQSLLKFIEQNPQALIANVKSQTKKHTLLQLSQTAIKIPVQKHLSIGQLVKIQHLPQQHSIQIRPIDAQQVLKTALTQLLPKSTASQKSDTLVSLLATVSSLTGKDVKNDDSIQQIINKLANEASSNKPVDALKIQDKFTPGQTKSEKILLKQNGISRSQITSGSSEIKSQKIDNILTSRVIQQVLQSLPQWSRIDSLSIQRWFATLGLIKGSESAVNQLPDQLHTLLQTNEKQNLELTRQIAQVLSRLSMASAKSLTELPLTEIAALIAKELNLQLESSITHLLLQQTSARYQQESTQNTQLNFSLPVVDQQLIKPVDFNIRQHQINPSSGKAAWEIQLAFEFAGMGLISSRILLDDNQVSTSFWAESANTQLKIEQNLDGFKSQLSAAGFDLGYFNCFPGKPAENKTEPESKQVESLLDIKV